MAPLVPFATLQSSCTQAASSRESSALRVDAILALQNYIAELSGKKHARSLLGYLWTQVPRLLFAESERVSQAAAICTGALGAAIYHSQGATAPQRSKPDSKRPQRGRKSSSVGGQSHRSTGTSASIQLPPTILITWAEGLLKGQPCPQTGYTVLDGQRPLVLQALNHCLQNCPAELQPAVALHVMKAMQTLLDSAVTDTRHLPGYLELMHDAVRLAHAADVGKLLPDMIDVFLGWAVDPTSTQACRVLMHKVIQSTGAAWHFVPQQICNIVASVTADMLGIVDSFGAPAATSTAAVTRPDMCFYMLSGILTAIATVLHHNPSPTVALSVELMARQVSILTSFSDIMMGHHSKASRSQLQGCPPPTVFVQTCLQHATVWLALMQRVAPAHTIAKALECPCCTVSLHRSVPLPVPVSWHHASAQSSAATVKEPTSRTVHEGIDDAVVFMVDCAFQNVLKELGADEASPTARSAAGGDRSEEHSLPLWLALFMLASLMVGVDFVSGQDDMLVSAVSDAGHSRAVAACRKLAESAAWTLLSVAIPMLEPVAPFCMPVQEMQRAVRDSGPPGSGPTQVEAEKSLSWAAQLWRLHQSQYDVVLQRASAETPESSRGIATFLLSLVTHRAGAPAIRRVGRFIRQAARQYVLEQASQGTSAAEPAPCVRAGTTGTLRGRFQFLFGLHLLQTALRRQALPLPALLQLAQELCSLAVALCMPSAYGSMLPVVEVAPVPEVATAARAAKTGEACSNPEGTPEAQNEQSEASSGLSMADRLQLLQLTASAAHMAMQTPVASHVSVHSCAATTFRIAAALLLQHCLQTDMLGAADPTETDAGEAAEDGSDSKDPIVHVSRLCSTIVQLFAHVLHRCPSALHAAAACVDLIVAKACSCSLHIKTALPATPAQEVPPPASSLLLSSDAGPGRPEQVGQALLAAAASLMHALMGQSIVPDAARSRLVLLAFTGSGISSFAKEQLLPVVHGAPSSRSRLASLPSGTTADSRGMNTAASTVQAGVDALLADVHKRYRHVLFQPTVANSFLDALIHLASGDAASAKVLLAPGGEKGIQVERQRKWASCIATVQQQHCHSATWMATRAEALQAIATSLVDCRFKATSGGAGQALMNLEQCLRYAMRQSHQLPATADCEGGTTATPLDRPVHCCVLPSWPALQVNSTGSAVAELLFFLQQRFHLAHTGSQLLATHSISDVAQLYFFVNRSETDKWMLRTCELRARAACAAASQHVALHAAFAWLLQVLSAARHYTLVVTAKKAPEAEEPPSNPNSSAGNQAAGGIEAVAPKPIKILRPQHPPEASKPRSVVKVQYQRKPEAAEQDKVPVSSDAPAAAAAEESAASQVAKVEGTTAMKLPKRLLLSAMQLAYLLCQVFEELREPTELRRLHAVLSNSLEPVLKQLLELDEQAQARDGQENNPLPAHVAGGRHTTAADLLAFVLGSAKQVEGRYEEAVVHFHTALTAGIASPVLPPEHTPFCMQQVACCYASLNDWKRLGDGWQAQGLTVSKGFELQSKLQGLQVWQPTNSSTDSDDEPQSRLLANCKPLNVAAMLDEPIMKAHACVSALFPAPPRSGQPQNIESVVGELGAAFDEALQQLSGAAAPLSANMAAEYVSLMHAGVAMTQLLIARLPPGAALPELPQWLHQAAAAEDASQHLLAASSMLITDVQQSDTLAACDTMHRRHCVLSDPLQAAYSGGRQATLDGAQLPLQALIFSVACKLASAHEYSVHGGAGTNANLPTKEAALQVLLTVGERSITAALQGSNADAAKRLLTSLMQSDVVAPLLVAGASARTSAHVQECLLRLQLQKLRYQLAAQTKHGGSEQDQRAGAELSPSTAVPRELSLDALLPTDLLEGITASSRSRRAEPKRHPFAVTSTGLAPLDTPAALEELWASLYHCLQPDGPLLASLLQSSGTHSLTAAHHALAASTQQLCTWTMQAAPQHNRWSPSWAAELRNILTQTSMTQLLHRQLTGERRAEGQAVSVNLQALLSTEVAQAAPALTCLAAAAVSSGHDLQSAWLRFGDWVYSRARHMRPSRRAVRPADPAGPSVRAEPELTEEERLCYQHVALAYSRVLALSLPQGGVDHPRLVLRLLHLAIHYHKHGMQSQLEAAMQMVPAIAWEVVAPQLFVQLHHSQQHVRAFATKTLAALAEPAPAAVLYTVVASALGSSQSGADHESEELQELLNAVAKGHPSRVAECRSLLAGLRRVTLVAAEEWQLTVQAAIVEIRRRLVTLKTEAERAQSATAIEAASSAVIWQRRYSTLLAHAISDLRRLLQDWSSRSHSTPHEHAIASKFVPVLEAAVHRLEIAPDAAAVGKEFPPKLRALEELAQGLMQLVPGPYINLTNFSPSLISVPIDASLPIPGHDHDCFVVGVDPKVCLLPSKTRPKRIDLVGSNGRRYRFLLKGGEDLQQEQRMQQLLSCVNSCLRSHVTEAVSPVSAMQLEHHSSTAVYHKAMALDELQLLTLNVTPLGTSMGLVQWVPKSTTLFDVFKGWQSRLSARYAAHGAATATSQATQRSDVPAPGAEAAEAAAGPWDGAGTGRSGRGRGRANRGRGRGRGRIGPAAVAGAQAQRNPCSADTAAAHERALEQATKVMLDLGGPQFPLLAQDVSEPSTKGPIPPNGAGASAAVAGDAHISSAAPKSGAGAAGRAGERQNGASNAPDAVAMKPSELFYSVLQHELRQAGLAPQLPRKEWPAPVLLKVHSQLLRKVPAQLLAHELSASAHDAVQWWGMHRRYTSSLALSSIASYLLGIGDRHLNNILLVQGSGQIVHVDSSVCFDQGASLRVPEVVPFRLTQMLVAALGPLGAQGAFSSDAATALAAARGGSSTITALLDAVVLDPSVDWIAAKRAAAADKRLDSAMALNLWLAHMQELLPVRLQRMIEVWRAHGAAALTALQSVREATELELDASQKLEAVQSLQGVLSMAEAREKELHAALNESQLAFDQHTQALQTHGPQIAGSLQQLRAEEARFTQLWQTLGLKDADPVAPVRLPPPLRAPPERWHSDYAPLPLTLVTAQARRSSLGSSADCLCTLMTESQSPALRSAIRTIPHTTLQACRVADDWLSRAWELHNLAHTALTQSIEKYTAHVPKLPGAEYTNTCHHSAWLRVLRGLSQARTGSVDEASIAHALMCAPVRDSALVQQAVAPLLAVVTVLQHAPHVSAKRKPAASGRLSVAARLLGLAKGSREVLHRGIVESVSAVVTKTLSAMQQLHECRAEAHAERRWRVPPAASHTDAWAQHTASPTAAVQADQQSPLATLPASATALLVDGELCRVLSDVSDALADISLDPTARQTLSVAPLRSALISAEAHVQSLQEASDRARVLSGAASRAAALHSFLTQAFCPSIMSVKLVPIRGGAIRNGPGSPSNQARQQEPVHVIQYLHQVFHDAATGLRHEIQQLLAAQQKEQQYRSLIDSCEAELSEVQHKLSRLPSRPDHPAGMRTADSNGGDNGSHEQALQQRLYILQSAIARRVTLTAELQQAASVAVAAVLQRVGELKAQLASSAALQRAVAARILADYNADALCASGAALDVDAVLAAETVKQGLLKSAEVVGPLVCGALSEFSTLLSSLQLSEVGGDVLRVPLSWYTGETRQPSQLSGAGGPFPPGSVVGIWGTSSIWGKPEESSWLSSTPAGRGSIWDDPGVGADVQIQSRASVTWPAQLNGIWSDVSAVFGVDSILEAAMCSPPEVTLAPQPYSVWDTDGRTAGRGRHGRGGGRSRGRGRGLTSALAPSPTARPRTALPGTNIAVTPAAMQHVCDEASMCVADVCMASIAAIATSHLSHFVDSFAQPGYSAAGHIHSPSSRAMPLPGLQPGIGADEHEHALLGALMGSDHDALGAAATLQPELQDDIPGGRQLEAFEFFNTEVQGADMMLGGLSQTSSIDRESVSDLGDGAGEGDSGSLALEGMAATTHDDLAASHVQAGGMQVDESWAEVGQEPRSSSAGQESGGAAVDMLALGNVTRCLTALLLRALPAEQAWEVGPPTPGSRTRATGRVPSALSFTDAAQQYTEMCTTASDVVLYHLRSVLWMLSHHLGTDFASFCSAAVSGDDLAAVLEEVGDPAAPSSERVHVLVGHIQQAAADMFDSQQAVRQWRAKFDAAAALLLQHYRACMRVPDTRGVVSQAVVQVQQWADDALTHSQTLLDAFCGGILSLEASRAGRSWAPRAAPDADAPPDILQGLPRAVRELSIAAVGAAHARDSLDRYTLEAEALSRETADAAARMPEVQAAATEAHAGLTSRAPALLEAVLLQLPSVQSLGQELPVLVATLHSDMRQVVRDLETLTKVHSAAADIAPVCGQLSKKWQSFRPRIEQLASGLSSVANSATASSALSQGASMDPVTSLTQLLTAAAEPAGNALGAVSHLRPRANLYAQFGALGSGGFSGVFAGNTADFSMDSDNAAMGSTRATPMLPHDAVGLVSVQVEDLLAQLSATQQAAEAVTASLQETVLHVRQQNASSGIGVARMDKNRVAFAKAVMKRTSAKLQGSASGKTLTVEQHVRMLIGQAVSTQRLSRMYEGWMPWL